MEVVGGVGMVVETGRRSWGGDPVVWNGGGGGGGSSGDRAAMEAEYVRRHHRHEPRENQCSSTLIKHIKAPIHLVRSSRSLVFIWFSCMMIWDVLILRWWTGRFGRW